MPDRDDRREGGGNWGFNSSFFPTWGAWGSPTWGAWGFNSFFFPTWGAWGFPTWGNNWGNWGRSTNWG